MGAGSALRSDSSLGSCGSTPCIHLERSSECRRLNWGQKNHMSENIRASSCRAAWWHAGSRHLPTGTAGARHPPPAATCLLAWDGHRCQASAPPWLICQLQSSPVPPKERCPRSGRCVGSSAGLCVPGTGRAEPAWALRLLAAGWEAPANSHQKIRSWFCCSSRSQPVEDNGKR